jgi:hypothetical protein
MRRSRMEKQLEVQETLLEPIELDDAELDLVAGGDIIINNNSFNGNSNSFNGNSNSFNIEAFLCHSPLTMTLQQVIRLI